MSSNLAVRVRRGKVTNLYFAGATIQSIATELNVSDRTIDRDLVEIRKAYKAEVKAKDAMDFFAEIAFKSDLRTKRLWGIILDKEELGTVRVAAINALREEDKELVKRMQVVGILPKDIPTQITVDNRTETINILNVIDETMERLKEEGKWNPERPLLRITRK